MPSSDLVILAILPGAVWIVLGLVAPVSIKAQTKAQKSGDGRLGSMAGVEARSWALCGLLAFTVVLEGVVAWSRDRGSGALRGVLNSGHWASGVLYGVLLGFALTGVLLLISRGAFAVRPKGKLVMIAGPQTAPWIRTAGLAVVVFAVELWRVMCLRALIGDGVSATGAWVATSVAYGLTFLIWSMAAAISEGVVGGVMGALFIWSGSFFVPLAAHLLLDGHVLLYAVADAPDQTRGGSRRSAFAQCPACRRSLEMRQVDTNPNEAFPCPFCSARITVSDSRRWIARSGSIFVSLALMVGFFKMLPRALAGSESQFYLCLLLTVCAGIGLYSTFQVVFPPKLEYGEPDFVGLGLSERRHSPSAEPTGDNADDRDAKEK